MNAAQYRVLHGRTRGQCTWCGGPVGKRRSTWCSQACVEAWRDEHDWGHIRKRVRRRDRGVCARCGCDTELQRRIVRYIVRDFRGPERAALARLLGLHPTDWYRDQWEANHRVARKDGGDNSLDNLETLCWECHRQESAAQQTRWKAERAEARAVRDPQGVFLL